MAKKCLLVFGFETVRFRAQILSHRIVVSIKKERRIKQNLFVHAGFKCSNCISGCPSITKNFVGKGRLSEWIFRSNEDKSIVCR